MPVFRVWSPDLWQTEDCGERVEAFDATEAAEEYSKARDRRDAEYPTERVVHVRTMEGELVKVRVWLESEPVYYSSIVRDSDQPTLADVRGILKAEGGDDGTAE